MDDGYFFNGGICLCSESFSYKDQIVLVELLKQKYNINAYLIKRTSNTWRICIHKSEMSRVRSLVLTHMFPEFLYKLGL